MALHGLQTAPFWLALAGVALVVLHVHGQPRFAAGHQSNVHASVQRLLENKYYLDWINENILARELARLGVGLWKVGDQAIIDGGVVNGSWKLVGAILAWCAGFSRALSVPLRLGDDPGCVRADDVGFLGRLLHATHQVRRKTK
jgi:NADH:ubiquinone oxidoreductase subunit 5 (subunit L)/multisubunit Na+/H+ antiporter MnhA subunit